VIDLDLACGPTESSFLLSIDDVATGAAGID
jgi:hypothetical protein